MASLVGTVTRRGEMCLRDRCSIPDRDKKFIVSLRRPDRVWNTSSLLFNGLGGIFRGESSRVTQLTVHLIYSTGCEGEQLQSALQHAFMVCIGANFLI